MKFPLKKRLFINQDGVQKRMELLLLSWESLISFSWTPGRQESPRLRVLSLNSARPGLEGWLCPSLVLGPWASYVMTPRLTLHICRVRRQWFQPTGILCRFNKVINEDGLAQLLAKLVLDKWQLILLLLYQTIVVCLLCTSTVLGIEGYKKEIIYNLCPRARSWQILFWKGPRSKYFRLCGPACLCYSTLPL